MERINTSRFRIVFSELAILWVLIILCIVMTAFSDSFLTPLNAITVLKQVSILGILAIGATFVLLSGGIDLSVGSTMALTGVISAMIAKTDSVPLIVPILVAILLGGGVGLLNGAGVAFAKMPAFIMTLGLMIVLRGTALLIAGGRPVFGLPDKFMGISGTNVFNIGNVPVSTLILYFLAVFAIALFLLNKTVYGKWIYGVGGNEIAARFSGIKTKRVILSVYIINGLLAGLCGVLMASRINSGDATVAESFALDAIAAAVIGGVSLYGGTGKVWKAVLGALIIGIIQNGLQIMGLSPFVQTIIQGSIIVVAVMFDMNIQHSNRRFRKITVIKDEKGGTNEKGN